MEKIAYRDDVLMKEYLRLCSEIESLESSNDRILGLGVGFVSIVTASAVVKDLNALFFALPFAILGLFFYGTWNYRNLYSAAGYKKHLEELINQRVGESLFLWEQLAPERRRRDIIRFSMYFIYMLVSTVVTFISIIYIAKVYGSQAVTIVVIFSVLFYGLLIACLRVMNSALDDTYRRSRELHAQGLPKTDAPVSDR